ncbi:MAG: two-component system OmpR family sensor kinase [Oleiphilaceae bacterium]|jgi:two-component system OmpR family sensor kinase|uniref:sensor histidine kinase n=1 Tax=Alteromonadales TaxID=135622 RepID=UPI000A1713B5|nr:HAMP domain-containing sensor histidine kinase [Colwellia polaris]|tara:strand:- start:6053 stop:7405 length:1353 start_codon:yes stop_codon:yes gene_type:complete
MTLTQTKKPQSLQKTLGIGLTLAVTLLWIFALSGAVYVSKNKLNELFDSSLAETAQRIMPLAVVEIINREDPGQAQQIMSFKAHDEHLVYLVRNNLGQILLQSHNADPAIFNQTLLIGFNSSTTHRFYGISAVQNTLHIEIAEPLTQRRAAITEMAISLLWPLILLIPLCFIGSWVFVRYSLRHILAYRNEIESRGGGDLTTVKVEGLPTEIIPIAESVNSLLDRLQRALESERSFTANSAHELRTPIATALAQIQRLQQKVSAGSIQDDMGKIETTLRGLSSLSEKLMQLAKAEGGGLLSAEPHNLISLLQLIVDDSQRSHPAKIITLTLPNNREYMSAIDPDAFAILIRNLLDNAIKHGVYAQPVEISFSSKGILNIVNAASVIPTETLLQLRRRFVRSNISVQGMGLGLAIADAIVSGVGATMTFNSPATGQKDGFEVSVDFSTIKD